MSTYMAKAENVERKWYIVDATDVPLGKTRFAGSRSFKR